MTRAAVHSSPTNGHSRFPSRKRCRQFLFAYPSIIRFALFRLLIRLDIFLPVVRLRNVRRSLLGYLHNQLELCRR